MVEIASLLAVSDGGDDPARLERTLTDGYARALALEAEHRRLEQQIARLVAASAGPQAPEPQEIASLLRIAKRQEIDLGVLRGQLGLLRRRHSSAVRMVAR
jgi:hypothetical protein